MGLLYGRAGRLTAKNGGFRPGQWLSDDEHGVRGWDSTDFADGPGLGASFDKQVW